MRIAYLGNFKVSFSTESHVALSIESLGHQVTRLQEGGTPTSQVAARAAGHDLFMWTQTKSLADAGGSAADRHQMLADLRAAKIPTTGFHLDRWWGLSRQHEVYEEAFFRVDRLFTADGGHQREWKDLGVNHEWLPPAVYHAEAVDRPPRGIYRADVVFVGAWRHYGHAEWWPYRQELLHQLRRRYRSRFVCWPQRQSIRGLELNRLFASAKVVIGDSCLAGGATRYYSDRVPETLGRGGFLLHPAVEGLDEHYTDGQHLRLYERGNFRELLRLVDHYLNNTKERDRIQRAGAAHVRANHTYRHRMAAIL